MKIKNAQFDAKFRSPFSNSVSDIHLLGWNYLFRVLSCLFVAERSLSPIHQDESILFLKYLIVDNKSVIKFPYQNSFSTQQIGEIYATSIYTFDSDIFGDFNCH